MAAAEHLMQGQLAGPTIAFLDEMPADLWSRLSTRLSNSTASAAQVRRGLILDQCHQLWPMKSLV